MEEVSGLLVENVSKVAIGCHLSFTCIAHTSQANGLKHHTRQRQSPNNTSKCTTLKSSILQHNDIANVILICHVDGVSQYTK